ncbi:transposase family protein [Pseudonocardia kujensis]|uniref:transposase family protein n=1 Tax=Pseudonocardia kujensis TaxID=1128675 RepID=UPI001E5A986D|nr:transposase family protein [Pseudonocardia kujensis]MCE0765951.1 transposase family protein [Pseudonocardia kujensis]
MPSYPAGLSVSNHALITLSDALRHRLSTVGTRWRRLSVGEQALLVVAHLRKGETYTDLAAGHGVGTTTVFRYIHEAIEVLAALAPDLRTAVEVAVRKAFVILDGTLLRMDRVGMGSGRDRPYYSGKHKCHGMNVQVIADPAGRSVWASPALPGARHDMGAARDHGIIDALCDAQVKVIADNGYHGSGFEVPQRRRPKDPATGRRRRLSENQKDVNSAHARQRGPGERANAQLKTWRILRKIRCCPRRVTDLVKAVLVLIHAG